MTKLNKPPSIILVSPQGDRNVGSVARAMQNFGASDLRIVDPRCEIDSHAAKQMAMHAFEIIKNARIFSTLHEAQADLQFSVAFSARDDAGLRPSYFLPEFVRTRWKEIESAAVGFVFGREESGLRLAELDSCDMQIAIPTGDQNSSLNLAMATALSLAQIHFQNFQSPEERSEIVHLLEPRPEKIREEIFFTRLQKLLVTIKYANPQNPLHTIDDMQRLYHRAELSDRELRILFGLLAGIEQQLDKADKKLIAPVHSAQTHSMP